MSTPSQKPTSPTTIAIDGPAAAGKSTVGRRVAEVLGYLYFDSGALYRALTVLALRHRTSPDDGPRLAKLATAHRIDVEPRETARDGYAVLAAGEDVTSQLRDPEVDDNVSAVSAHREVRQALLSEQRRLAHRQPTVMVGRDIGTAVLPDAQLKIYLDAAVAVRARRRFRERLADGEPALYRDVLAAIRARDERDARRSIAPLRAAATAVVVNTDLCDLEGVVAHCLMLVRRWPDALTRSGGDAPCRPAHADKPGPGSEAHATSHPSD